MVEPGQPQSGSGRFSRRTFIGVGLAVSTAATAGGLTFLLRDRPSLIKPSDLVVDQVERLRASTGKSVRKVLVANQSEIDLGGRIVSTSAFGNYVHGPLIRANVGDEIRVTLKNDLTSSTTVHWHGLALRNDMDGVPGVTMPAVKASTDFEYVFKAPTAGTYWYHPHVGTQLDTGLYGPLVIDDPNESANYDVEATLMLDDWTDGWGRRPDNILKDMRVGGMNGMSGMNGMKMSVSENQPLGEDTGDVAYPGHLINGRLPADPITITARPGQRVKLRIINAGGDTAYRFAVEGHPLKVTHADGFAVSPVSVDAFIIGMGERYDVEIEARDGIFAIVAVPEGKDDPAAMALLRTSSGRATTRPREVPELSKRLLSYRDLLPDAGIALPVRSIDKMLDLSLGMGRGGREWLLNGKTFADHEPLTVSKGDRVRIRIKNSTMMFHPMHLHGHTFALTENGTRKDTVNVLPMASQSIDFDADNPGQWLIHCHNVYHGELGMMTVVSYVT
ncbi:multicopper oxidase family protein [soil metagenome]